MPLKKRGLGKGLDAIFAENTAESTEGAVNVKISEIEPNREQPRKEFDSEALSELADSISQHGVLQPLLLRPLLTGGYRIVAGERRWRAARMAGLTAVPAVIREMTDAEERYLDADYFYDWNLTLVRIEIPSKVPNIPAKIITQRELPERGVVIFGPREYIETPEPEPMSKEQHLGWLKWRNENYS